MAVTESVLLEAGIRVGLLSAESIANFRLLAKRERLSLLEVATREARFPAAALYQALASLRNLPFVQPSELIADKELVGRLSRKILQRGVLPISGADNQTRLAMSDPDDRLSLEQAERTASRSFDVVMADPRAIKSVINQSLSSQPASASVSEVADPVLLLDEIMKEAYLRRASDIHFEPQENEMGVRLRVDGRLQEFPQLFNRAEEEALLNRIKVLADLDIAERRMTQDGAMKYRMQNWNMPATDIRVATIPTRWGERCTLRILGQQSGNLSLNDLGMSGPMLTQFREEIEQPHGMILVTGPTGSGKSTTLYAAIRELPIDRLNVLTAEDPVEQTVAGITQVQMSTKVNFAAALRSFLRHDPDVILVGEMRDQETVDIGLRAAMTGHLLLSTLHTNDAIGAVTRLADIGAERFLIGSTLNGVLAQRLGRRLCKHCRSKRECTEEESRILDIQEGESNSIYEAPGCSFCLGKGTSGRIGFFEALWMTQDLRAAITEGAGEREIRKLATRYTSLWDDCRAKVLNGYVSLKEVMPFRPEVHG